LGALLRTSGREDQRAGVPGGARRGSGAEEDLGVGRQRRRPSPSPRERGPKKTWAEGAHAGRNGRTEEESKSALGEKERQGGRCRGAQGNGWKKWDKRSKSDILVR